MAMARRAPELPFVARTLMPREIRVNALMAVALGAMEGGLVGVIVKNRFDEVAEPGVVNLCVALVTGAPALANVASLAYAALARGRDKTTWVAALMGVAAAAVLVMALMPATAAGLLAITAAMIAARLAFSGVITLRAAIWRANFPRHVRARITGRIAVTYSLIMAVVAGLIGLSMDFHPDAWRWLFPVAGVLGLVSAWRYRRFTVRGHGRLLRQESAAGSGGGGLREIVDVLRRDYWYRRYMLVMFVFGSGNLMVIALLVVILTEQLGVPRFQQVLITTSLPLVSVALFTPWWARHFDGAHILDYRARHSWMFVIAMGTFVVGAATGLVALFWLGALALGAAFAGGKLGWNLGHNDFASDGQSTLYMGIHVSLTGVRGLLAPVAGVAVYQGLEAVEAGLGRYVLVLPFLLTLGGAFSFVYLARLRRREHQAASGAP